VRRGFERLETVDVETLVNPASEARPHARDRAEEALGVERPAQAIELAPSARAGQLADRGGDSGADAW
jgi:hypothetical protein